MEQYACTILGIVDHFVMFESQRINTDYDYDYATWNRYEFILRNLHK